MRKNLQLLADAELIGSLKSLAGDERCTIVSVLRHLNEFDRRRLAMAEGFPSLFEYCVRELRYAQGEAARRIHAARAASKYPILYRAIERGLLTLTTVSLIAPHLKWDNYRRLIRSSIGRSTREVEALIASLVPLPVVPAERVRFVAVAAVEATAPSSEAEGLFAPPIKVESPATPPASSSISAELPAASAAPAVRRVHFSFTADEALLRDVERVKELSRHKWPAGRLEDVFAGAILALLDKIDPDRRSPKRPRRSVATGERSRTIPRSVKDEVWRRDGGRCVFMSSDGSVCGARAGLQVDHVAPWALGGASNDPGNLRLLCRAHNAFEARCIFGDAIIDAAVVRGRGTLRRGVKI